MNTQINELENQLRELEAQKEKLFDNGADQVEVSRLNEKIKSVQAQLNALRQQDEQEQIVQKQEEHNGGLKEVIYQVFESVLPKEMGHKSLGISEYDELSQSFRMMIDLAVDENNQELHKFIGEQIETKDGRIRELTGKVIDLEADLQEAQRREEQATSNYSRALSENERLEKENIEIANKSAEKDVLIAECEEQLQAKEEQIAKLTEELNKPKSGIILPSQAKPSQSLAEMMAAAKDKAVKSSRDLALERLESGQMFRGKVEITPPPLGGSNDSISFLGQDQTDTEQSGISVTEEAPVVPSQFQSEDAADELVEGNTDMEMAGETLERYVTRKEFEALKHEVAALKREFEEVIGEEAA